MWDSSVSMATLLSVVTLVLTGQPITPVNVFMLLGFMNLATSKTCSYISFGLLQGNDAYASLGRIEDFLVLENLPAISCGRSEEDTSNPESKATEVTSGLSDQQAKMAKAFNLEPVKNPLKEPSILCVSNLTNRNIGRQNEFILQDIEFSTAPRSLTVITGPVGSGKSTLLSAIAGEISEVSGTITFQGSFVYVPQTAWIFSGTIRENILFGQPHDETKYNRVIEACALTEDIQRFPDCDQTVVGVRGEVLSGGQKARISLARAVYADADFYLLDDPLSAVDFKVGQHIFKTCINDLLGEKMRVLTSHQEQHMKEADQSDCVVQRPRVGKGKFHRTARKGYSKLNCRPALSESGER